MTQTQPLLINNYEPITTYIPNNNKLYLILLFILMISIVNTIFFIRVNSIINDITPYTSEIKTLIDLACKDLQC